MRLKNSKLQAQWKIPLPDGEINLLGLSETPE